MMKSWVLPIVSAALGSLGFAMFFGIKSKKLIWCTVGGALTWAVYLIGMEMGMMEILAYALGAAAGTLFSEILARIVKTPVTMFAITSVIPMVPGGTLYYTMLGLLQGNQEVFVEKGLYMLAISGAMALGMFVATMLFRVFLNGTVMIGHARRSRTR